MALYSNTAPSAQRGPAWGRSSSVFKLPSYRTPSATGGNLAAQLAALNPSGGPSWLAPTSLPGYTGAPFGPPTAASSGATTPYDFNNDPIFAQTQALIGKTEEEAKAAALARTKQLGIQFGDASGLGVDAATVKAASDNPFSVIASQKRGYDQGVTHLEDALNKSNLFYSGWRGDQLGQAATGYQQNQYNSRSRFQASITDVQSALQQALLQAQWQRLAALQSAYASGLGNPSGAAGGTTSATGASSAAATGVTETWVDGQGNHWWTDTGGATHAGDPPAGLPNVAVNTATTAKKPPSSPSNPNLPLGAYQ